MKVSCQGRSAADRNLWTPQASKREGLPPPYEARSWTSGLSEACTGAAERLDLLLESLSNEVAGVCLRSHVRLVAEEQQGGPSLLHDRIREHLLVTRELLNEGT